MAYPPILTVLQVVNVSPPPATVDDRSLSLTFSDIIWLLKPPIHHLFFYELPLISKTNFLEEIVPKINHSLSKTLQHFFPYVGNLVVFPTPTRKPEIRYVEGDCVKVTISECNLDFSDLTGNHPRKCDIFYHLIPPLGHCIKISDYITIPVFSVQVTLFPNHGFSLGITSHHSLADVSTQINFLKAWTLISRCGTDKLFLSTGTLPVYDRLVKYPTLDEINLKNAKVETLNEKYQPPSLSGPTDKVRATFILTSSVIKQFKKLVSTQLPTLPHVSAFTVSCAYIWSCMAKSCNSDLEMLVFAIDCRARMDPVIPAAYFGNCLMPCLAIANTTVLKEEGFVTIAKLLGESLHKVLTTEDGIVNDKRAPKKLFPDGIVPKTMIGVAGTPRLKLYDMDFGWGNPKKHELISIDYGIAMSMNASKELDEDMEIGISLSAMEMKAFVHIFNDGLKVNI